jgi:dimethylamine/trimethylamine dehydrogenase
MECAIVLGKRGLRRVHLVEAEPEVGGSVRWISRLPGLGEWARIVNYRTIQLRKLRNVEVLTGLRLDAPSVREYGADLVVVATGARWAADGTGPFTHEPIPGACAGLTPEQVMLEGRRPAGTRVVVYDCEGYFAGPGIAGLLAGEGYAVELVTPLEQVSPFSDLTLEGPMLRRQLHEAGVAMRRGCALTAIAPGAVTAETELGEQLELEADGVVLVTQRVSDDSLYRELAGDPGEGVEAVYRVGDCVAPQLLADAIFDGHRLAREIDSPDPAVPLPHRRERVAL